MSLPAKRVTVVTHRRPDEIRTALTALREAALAAGATLRFDAEETAKLGLEPARSCAHSARTSTRKSRSSPSTTARSAFWRRSTRSHRA